MRNRPSKDETFLEKAVSSAKRATCARRMVGCVLVDRHGNEIATGYNGNARGWPHCIDHPCPGACAAPGQGLDKCEAIHAEQNALLQCPDTFAIHTVYCTDSPCVSCTKLLLNTSAVRIVYLREYPHSESREWWTRYPMTLDGEAIPRTWEAYPNAERILSLFDR